MSKTRILFVDDEALLLEMLRLTLESMSAEWEMAFANSGEGALELMAQAPFEVVVSDMRMPGMSGAQLLNEVMQRHPATIRLILSGYAEEDQVIRCVGATHQFLAKPFELAALVATLEHVRSLKGRLHSPELRRLLVKRDTLPTIPAVYFQVLEALQAPDRPLEAIARMVAMDPGLTARSLQLVNSAFFGFARKVSSAEEALSLLGLSTIRSLALTTRLFAAFEGQAAELCPVEQVWGHSMQVAHLARRLVQLEGGDERLAEQAFTAGLLHDLGKLILADNLGPQYAQVLARSRSDKRHLSQVEQELLHATHAEAGAYLMDLWGLPAPLVEAVALHHQPGATKDPALSALTAVHVANVLANEFEPPSADGAPSPLDLEYLGRLGLAQRVPAWRSQLRPGTAA